MEEMEGSGVGGLEGWQDSCPPFNEDQWQFLSKVNLVVGGYATIAVAIIGIIANSLAIAVFARKNFKSNFNSLLIGLSTFDLLFLITMITESVRKNFEGHFGDPESLAGRMTSLHHILFPYFLYPLTNILLTASIYMTVSISVERFVAIFYPLVYKVRSQGSGYRSLTLHILPVILLAVTVNLPTFFATQVDLVEDGEFPGVSANSTMIGVTSVRKHKNYEIYYQTWTRFLVLGLVPMLLLVILNLRVFSAIAARKSTCRDASYANILLLIVLVFILCQSPRLFLNFWALTLDHCGPPVWFEMLNTLSEWLICLNSALNFFIYCMAGAKFRQGLSSLLCCCSSLQPSVTAPPSTSHTAMDLKSQVTKL